MTCIDKLRELFPDLNEDQINQYVKDYCPEHFYIAPEPSYCFKTGDCVKCWNREIPDDVDEAPVWKQTIFFKGEQMRRLERLEKRLDKPVADVIGTALKLCEDGLDAVDKSMRRGTYMSTSFELKE